jgi:hypothetical protein
VVTENFVRAENADVPSIHEILRSHCGHNGFCAAYAESSKLYREVLKYSLEDASLAEATEKAYSRCPDANR